MPWLKLTVMLLQNCWAVWLSSWGRLRDLETFSIVLILYCWMTTYSATITTCGHTGCRVWEVLWIFFLMGFDTNGTSWSCVRLAVCPAHSKDPGQWKSMMEQWQHIISFHLPSASFLLSQCWRKMTVTSPESLSLYRRSHPFSQSDPTGLNCMGRPEYIPDTGELCASLFCFILWCPRTKVQEVRECCWLLCLLVWQK